MFGPGSKLLSGPSWLLKASYSVLRICLGTAVILCLLNFATPGSVTEELKGKEVMNAKYRPSRERPLTRESLNPRNAVGVAGASNLLQTLS